MKIAILLAALMLAGCSTTPQTVTRTIAVPSSAPYRFITYSEKTDDATAKQIRRHNRAHALVIEAEKKAKAQH